MGKTGIKTVQEALNLIEDDFARSLKADFFATGPDIDRKDTTDISEALKTCRAQRAFFRSARGNPLGQRPPGAKARDFITLVLGYWKPLLIRSMGEDYQLVGQCYIRGMMGNWVKSNMKRGRLKAEYICWV